jgi:sugar lactone lactonase YvrE
MIREITTLVCFTLGFASNVGSNEVPTVRTIAGGVNGKTGWEAYGFSGDSGPATESALDEPYGLSVDSDGNLFIADQQNHRIRKIDTDGNISTVAGIGLVGFEDFAGDGGSATEARLFGSTDVFAHASGEIYIADHGNGRIRKIDTSGIIHTVAGGGINSPSAGGSALEASFKPYCIAVDTDGTMYIGTFPNYDDDPQYHQVLRVGPEGSIFVFAGTASGTAGFEGDGGPATEALLNQPHDVAIGPDGSVYIADYYNHRVRVVDTNGVINTYAGSGESGTYKYGNHYSGDGASATEAELNAVRALAISDAGNVYIGEYSNYCVRGVGSDGIIETIAGGVLDDGGNTYSGFFGDGGSSTEALFDSVHGLALDSSGNLYISSNNQRIRVIEAIESFAPGDGSGNDEGSADDGQSDTVELPSGEVGPIGLDLDLADGDQMVRQTATNPKDGDQIQIDVFITEGASGQFGFNTTLAWDPAALTYTGYASAGIFAGGVSLTTPSVITAADSTVELSVVTLGSTATGDTGSSGLATFTVNEGFSGSTTVRITSGKIGSTEATIGPGAAFVVIGGQTAVEKTPAEAANFDGDSTVGFGDFLIFAGGFGKTSAEDDFNTQLDLDGDGAIGFGDFLSFAAVFGQTI